MTEATDLQEPVSATSEPKPPAAFVSLAEAAATLGISHRTAQRLAATDNFPVPVVRIGARFKVSRVLLDRLASGADAPAESA